MEVESKIGQLVKYLNICIPAYYKLVRNIFENPYDYATLDPIRNEICKCIICGLFQASITLTNFLLERSLKHCLSVGYIKENKRENINLDRTWIERITTYDKLELGDTINRACTQGLITKEQKNQLKDFKIKFRNPYSQANADIVNDINVRGKDVTARHLDNGLDIFFGKMF